MHALLAKLALRRAFTLVELLVVISITGMLLALVLPAVQNSRESSRRIKCESNLKQVGMALSNYLDARGNSATYPQASEVPSLNLTPNIPPINKILNGYVEHNQNVFRCPDDVGNPVYFERDGLSFDYPTTRLAGKTRAQALLTGSSKTPESSSRVTLMWDFDPFHGGKNTDKNRNFLYADGHVQIQ
jgi:prepilin-type N-terminal cleavage/methylation domain-containing protein/prepilin-type processing-associated H-X9-DG protein